MLTKFLWRALGLLFVGCAYIGAIVPGIPTTVFLVLALWCFSKSSEKLRLWIWEHPVFGKYVRDWTEKKIYPTRAKWIMFACCAISYAWLIAIPLSNAGLISVGLFMLFWLAWAWRYPGSEEEYQYRVDNGKRVGWLK